MLTRTGQVSPEPRRGEQCPEGPAWAPQDPVGRASGCVPAVQMFAVLAPPAPFLPGARPPAVSLAWLLLTCCVPAPAVYPDGRVCISILHAPGDDPMGYESSAERWSPVQSVEKILLSVVSMLAGE